MSPTFKDKSINPYTIYILYVPMYGVRCVMRGGGGRGKGRGGCQILTSLNPLPEGGGAQPIMNDQETILVVQKFNTRGLALAEIKLISLF